MDNTESIDLVSVVRWCLVPGQLCIKVDSENIYVPCVLVFCNVRMFSKLLLKKKCFGMKVFGSFGLHPVGL